MLVLSVAACTDTPAPRHSEPSARFVTPPPFVPRTYREGETVVMPVTFPDGSMAEVVYSRELDLASRGVRPYTWALLETSYGSLGRDFRIDPGRLEDVWRGDPIRDYEGADGVSVPFMRDVGGDGMDYLAFGFGSWTVSVYDYPVGGARMTEEERSIWARSLTGHETEDGFLLLQARPPLRLARAGELSVTDGALARRPGRRSGNLACREVLAEAAFRALGRLRVVVRSGGADVRRRAGGQGICRRGAGGRSPRSERRPR